MEDLISPVQPTERVNARFTDYRPTHPKCVAIGTWQMRGERTSQRGPRYRGVGTVAAGSAWRSRSGTRVLTHSEDANVTACGIAKVALMTFPVRFREG